MRHSLVLLVVCLCAITIFSGVVAAQPSTPACLAMYSGSWAYKLSGIGGGGFVAAVGTVTMAVGSTNRSTSTQGISSSTITINHNGTTDYSLMPAQGTYQVDSTDPNSPCGTGTLLLASGTNPSTVRTLRFVGHAKNVAGTTFNAMYLVSVDNDGVVLTGEATKITPTP